MLVEQCGRPQALRGSAMEASPAWTEAELSAERDASRGRATVVTVPAMPEMTANYRKGRLLRAL